MPDQIDPSPAQLGDSTTIVPDTWTVIDDAGTEIYLYGDQIRQPVTIVVRSGQDSPTTSADRDQARAELADLRRQLNRATDEATGYRLFAAAAHRDLRQLAAASVPAARAQGAATPAVDPAPARTTQPQGDRTGGDDHGPQRAAETITCAGCGDDIWPGEATTDGQCAICAVAAQHGATPSTPDRPQPGPQDIPPEWMLVHLRRVNIEAALDIADDELLAHPETDAYRQAIRSAYRVGYAAAHGCEITVAPEGDYIHIGDRWPAGDTEPVECPSLADIRTGRPVPTGDDAWAALDQAMRPVIAQALSEEQPAHVAYHWGRSWSPTTTEAACPCPKAPCGYVIDGSEDPGCTLHTRDKTRRGGHPAGRCPARP